MPIVKKNAIKAKAFAFFFISIAYLLVYGLWIKEPMLNAIAIYSRTQQSWIVLAVISPAWIFFAFSLHFYYEHKKSQAKDN